MASHQARSAVYSTPLEFNEQQFRLLTLLPASNSEQPLHCNIHVASLNPPFVVPAFEALSYEWGGNEPAQEVVVDGVAIPLSPNLASALRYLRLKSKPRVLWVDALCIGRDNVRERNYHAKLSSNIFGSAAGVLCWLGELPAEVSSAITFAKFSKGRPWWTGKSAVLGMATKIGGLAARKIQSCNQELSTFFTKVIQGLSYLDTATYWRRIWIIQEVLKSRTDPLIICQHGALPASLLQTLLADRAPHLKVLRHGELSQGLADAYNIYLGTRTDFFPTGDDILKLRALNLAQALPHFQLLRISASSGYSDPADRLYALYGLFTQEPGMPQLGYEKDYELEIIPEWTAYFLSKDQLPDIMSIYPLATTGHPTLPSWVPNLAVSNLSVYQLRQSIELRHPIRVSSPALKAMMPTVAANKKRMLVHGIHFGRIARKVNRDQQMNLTNNLKEFIRLIKQVGPVSRIHDSKLLGLSAFLAKQRALDGYRDVWGGIDFIFRRASGIFSQYEDRQLLTRVFEIFCPMLDEILCITEYGFLATAQEGVEIGDSVVYVVGMTKPYILRPKPKSRIKRYTVLSSVELPGITDEDVREGLKETSTISNLESFSLV
jgi:hypothetical protein